MTSIRMSSTDDNADRQKVVALVRGLNLLACFRVERPVLTNAELSRLCDLPRSSVSRLTHTLVKEGYLEYDSARRGYRLGAKVLSIGHAMHGGMILRSIALPHMQKMADISDSQVAIATCEDTSMLIIEVATAATMRAYPMEVGARMAVDMTAMGRVHIASSSRSERERIIRQLVEQRQRKPQALKAIIDSAVHEFMQKGYCTSIQEWRKDVNGVAVPMYLKDLGRRLVLTCGGQAQQLTEQSIHKTIAPMLLNVAKSIETLSERQ